MKCKKNSNQLPAIGTVIIAFLLEWQPALRTQTPLENFQQQIRSPAVDSPFIFNWGGSYADTLTTLRTGNGRVKKNVNGEQLTVQREEIEYDYRVFIKEQIKEIVLEPVPLDETLKKEEKKPQRTVWQFARLILEKADEPANARLFAVKLTFPPLAADEKEASELITTLKSIYPGNSGALPELLSLYNDESEVKLYFNNYRQQRYLTGILFSSKEIRREMEQYERNREKQFNQAIQKRVKEANRQERLK